MQALFGPWDSRRSRRFAGRWAAFQIDGDTSTWFTGTITAPCARFPLGSFTFSSPDDNGEQTTCSASWITRAFILPAEG
jgi:hypothetical protein